MMADYEGELQVPTGNMLKAVIVNIRVRPEDAGARIYGNLSNGTVNFVEVIGPKTNFELPFINGHIYAEYIGKPDSFRVDAVGWIDDL